MRALIQRTTNASVTVNGCITGKIDKGTVVLVGFTYGDTVDDIDYIINKLINLRIFDDENGVMNKSLLDTGGSVLSISQFTLYADTKSSGRRPSYVKALKSSEATVLYDLFNKRLKDTGVTVETGIFGADMKVDLTNDGPVTIMLESEKNGQK